MSKTVDLLRTVGVYNSSEFYGPTPYLIFRASYAPDPIPSGWVVIQRGVDLNDGWGHWSDRDGKMFVGGKRGSLEPALAWARERFEIAEWKRDPFGSYGPARFVVEHLAYLRRQAAA